MKIFVSDVVAKLQWLMDNVYKTTSYQEGKSDGFNIVIREVESLANNIESLSIKEKIQYIPDEILNTIENMKIMNGLKIEEDFAPMDVYITKRSYNPNTYAVMIGNNRMNNIGEISCEPMPSSRTKEYTAKYSFSSIEEAWECFDKYYK